MCCRLFVLARCVSLCVVRCLIVVVRCLSLVVRRLVRVVGGLLRGDCWLLFVV